ncbi:hypothetical protein IFM89_039725 [Coptis chinensis]|uniref:PGG domain-containing protein n=1 Tax=Coptis chinensis TaxID=261450 RepID=A0A835GTJ8_9MAGN|nr:hypothetical protein IFM89_039725 [Coptis chinensis]
MKPQWIWQINSNMEIKEGLVEAGAKHARYEAMELKRTVSDIKHEHSWLYIFNLPGQYLHLGPDAGKANIADNVGFQVFCLLNATSLFISLAVVVVQITLVAWDTSAQEQVVTVVNKLMWAACLSTCGAFALY